MLYRFGRAPREFDEKIPHLRDLEKKKPATPPPPRVDNTQGMPEDLGMMLNQDLNDCTCAGYYHARQVWTFLAEGAAVTEPDEVVEKLYAEVSGYTPGMKNGGHAVSMQHVLRYLTVSGAPTGTGGKRRERLIGFVEVDPKSVDHLKRAISECGVAYIGFLVPKNIWRKDGQPKQRWTYEPHRPRPREAHAVILTGYNAWGATAISWGKRYRLEWSFITHFADEAYALADRAWLENGNATPLGRTKKELIADMLAFRESAKRRR